MNDSRESSPGIGTKINVTRNTVPRETRNYPATTRHVRRTTDRTRRGGKRR